MNFLSTVKDNRRYVVYGIWNNFSHFLTRASNISMYMVELSFHKRLCIRTYKQNGDRWLLWSNKKDSLNNHCQGYIFFFILQLILEIKLGFHLQLCVTNQVLNRTIAMKVTAFGQSVAKRRWWGEVVTAVAAAVAGVEAAAAAPEVQEY